MSSGIEPLAGFFELWLRDVAAALMGEWPEERWRDHMEDAARGVQRQGLHSGVGVPAQFTLDVAVVNSRQTWPSKPLFSISPKNLPPTPVRTVSES